MTEQIPKKSITKEEWEEIIPKGELGTIALNTEIPRKLNDKILRAKVLLQTTSSHLVFTKKATVQILLERGLQSLYEDWQRADLSQSENVILMNGRETLADRVAKGFTV
jgi:hypothetical protein